MMFLECTGDGYLRIKSTEKADLWKSFRVWSNSYSLSNIELEVGMKDTIKETHYNITSFPVNRRNRST
jgi:hypothetical protein